MSENVENMSISELVDSYECDIKYDCHNLEAKISRSLARIELEKRGRESFPFIMEQLNLLLPKEDRMEMKDCEWLQVWTIPIAGIIDNDPTLPPAPFDGNVPYGKQTISAWVNYLNENKLDAPCPHRTNDRVTNHR